MTHQDLPQSTTETTVVAGYCIRLATGELVRLSKTSNNDRGSYCGDYTYQFSTDESDPLFFVKSWQGAAIALTLDTPWFNSDEDRPNHGDGLLDLEGATVVHSKTTTRHVVNKVNRKLPVSINDGIKRIYTEISTSWLVVPASLNLEVGSVILKEHRPISRVTQLADLKPEWQKRYPNCVAIVAVPIENLEELDYGN